MVYELGGDEEDGMKSERMYFSLPPPLSTAGSVHMVNVSVVGPDPMVP